jgi:hypothetical protein
MKITIKIKDKSIIEYIIDQDIPTVEMPYMCVGYRFNGSSQASIEDLNKYWDIVDVILKNNDLKEEDYETLMSME